MNNDNKGNLAAETRRGKKKPLVPLVNFSLIKFLQGIYLWVAGWGGKSNPCDVRAASQLAHNAMPGQRHQRFHVLFENNRPHLSLPTTPPSDTHGELICIRHLRLPDA